MATGTRPSDEHYWRQPWSSTLFAGDLFEAIPVGTQPTVAVEAENEEGAHKHYVGGIEFAYGLLISPTCDMTDQATGGSAHPYREGRIGVVDLASQLGHSPTMTLNTYGHVIAELREAPRTSATESIEAHADPRTTPRGTGPSLGESKTALARQAAERIRTADPFITSEVLYQLSYGGGAVLRFERVAPR
jgi:hypothetical protein